jgi:hypothetical protein
MPNARPPWFRRPWALEVAGLALVAVLGIVLAITWGFRRTGEAGGDVATAGSVRPIEIVKPTADSPFDRTFSWRPVDGAASYSVAVFRGDGERSFEVRDVKGAGVALSPTVKLAPGPYFWQVIAVRNGETIAESPRTPFAIPDP